MDASGVESNNLLSQSYAQGLERIARHKDQLGFFELPSDIIKAREQTWDSLCKKYSEELSDEIEITLNSPSDEEDEDTDDDEEENDENEEEDDKIDDKYFAKSRTPIRKSKLLVQYWVDTGNPPYALMNDNYKSDTGSSLSEAESPKMGQSHVSNTSKERMKKNENGTSIYSSVDTAAYILSNTNVTKKAETAAIVEGARKSLDSSKHLSGENENLNTSQLNNSTGNDTSDNNTSPVDSVYTSQILTKLEEKIQRKSLNQSRTSLHTSDESDEQELDKSLPTSMKITDVLPTLEQLDKLMRNSTVNGLKKLPDEGSRESSRTPPFSMCKKFNRRKLYTGRDSPMDIIVSSSLEDNKLPSANHIHPAFQGTPRIKMRPSVFRRKSLANKGQRKLRSSADSQDKNSESVVEGPTTKFFKSLGLVPSPSFNTRTKRKTIGGVASRKVSKKKQGKKLDKRRSVASDNDNDRSGEASGECSNSIDGPSDLLVLCTKKLLSVPLERLSESVLRRVDQRQGAEEDTVAQPARRAVGAIKSNSQREMRKETEENVGKKEVESLKSRDSVSKRANVSVSCSKIEVDSQGSDQSTIIICECKKDGETSFAPQNRSTQSDEPSENSRETVLKKKLIKRKDKRTNVIGRSLRKRTGKLQVPDRRKMLRKRNLKAKKINLKNVNNNKEIMIVIDRCPLPVSSPNVVKQITENPMEKKIEKSPKLTTIGTHLTTDCDSFSESSIDKRKRKQANEAKRRQANPIITFSSDDESDFIKVMNRSAEKYERKLRNKSKYLSKDQEQLINDLTAQPVELLLNRIAESDEEETIEFTDKVDKSTKQKSVLASKNQKSVTKSPQKAARTSKRLSIVRVLSFDDSSSKKSEEVESPPKKFKTENGVINKPNTKKSTKKSGDSDSSSLNESMNLLFGRSKSNGSKSKTDYDKPDEERISSNKSPIKTSQSPIIKLTRIDKSKVSPIKYPLKRCEVVIESPMKQLTSPSQKSQDIQLKELHITIQKIPEDLEKSFQKIDSKFSPSKSLNSNNFKKSLSSIARTTRSSRKRSLPSDDESSEPDFIIKEKSSDNILINHDSSDVDSTKCTKLFYNPFDDSDDGLKIPFNRKQNKNRLIKNLSNNSSNNNRTLRILRTRHDSDSDD